MLVGHLSLSTILFGPEVCNIRCCWPYRRRRLPKPLGISCDTTLVRLYVSLLLCLSFCFASLSVCFFHSLILSLTLLPSPYLSAKLCNVSCLPTFVLFYIFSYVIMCSLGHSRLSKSISNSWTRNEAFVSPRLTTARSFKHGAQ